MVRRIVLTGGPGSGKTSVLEKINKVYKFKDVIQDKDIF